MVRILDMMMLLCAGVWITATTMFIWLIKADFEFAETWPVAFGILAFFGLAWLVLWLVKINHQN